MRCWTALDSKMKLIVLLLLSSVITICSQSSVCSLNCFNDGVCMSGSADFSEHPTNLDGTPLEMHVDTQQNGDHCACRPGYTGLLCGIKYEDCADPGLMCYNGGKCILGLSDIYGNNQLYCDCSEAVDEHNVTYVGKYCEIPKTQTCDDAGLYFCVNSGWCKSDYELYPRRPCHCGTQHDGQHCEFDKGAVPDCTLKCHNGGECRLGIKPDPTDREIVYDFWKNNSDYQYCECPDGFYGLQCEVTSTKCGSHDCFHGGECVTISKGTSHRHYCDCTTTHTATSSYAGEFCQYESDNFCDTRNTTNGQLFCVNGGVCHQDGSQLACECPSGFHGPICEFRDEEQSNAYESCSIACANNGTCRNGAKDNSLLEPFAADLSEYNVAHNSNFDHCVCPEGFVGLTCEDTIEICPNGEHVCLHGSKCIPDSDGEGSACDCDAGATPIQMVAGKYCEHKSTSICTSGDTTNSRFAFCVNNGECVDVIGDNNEE